MVLTVGSVVLSKAGRDKGKLLTAVSVEERYVLLADGGERPLDNPKRKNIRHIAVTNTVLTAEQRISNRALRKALSDLTGKGGML